MRPLEVSLTVELTYRLFREADLPGLLRLWEENTQWGALTPETWRQRYIDSPHGPSLVVVAVDENDAIAGQLILTSAQVIVDDREVRALRLSAPILRKDLNRASLRSTDHPAYHLYKRGEEAALAAGYDLWYALPRYGWLPMFPVLSRFVGREILLAEYPCLGITITPQLPVATEEYAGLLSVRHVTDFGTQYETLWQAAKDSFPIACGVVRSSGLLRHNSARSLTLEVCNRRDGTLVGYASIRRQLPLLYDILARDPASLTPVLAGVLEWLATEESGGGSDAPNYLNAMETPALGPTLHGLGFTPVDFRFGFACATLNPSLSIDAIVPERWYITPSDHGL